MNVFDQEAAWNLAERLVEAVESIAVSLNHIATQEDK